MDLRLLSGLLFLTLPLAAQAPFEKPVEAVVTTPEQQIAELEQEKQRLVQEIEYVRERVTNAKDLLAEKLQRRTLQGVRSIDAGRSAVAQPKPPVARRPARLMLEEEAAGQPQDVMLTVNGAPVTRAMFDALVAQQADRGAPEMRSQMAIYELLRIEGVAAEFAEGDLEDSLAAVVSALAEGKTVAELAPDYTVLPGAEADGRVEVMRNQRYGLRLEQVAFATEAGQTSRPFRHHDGIAIVHVDSVEKGASPDLDKVVAHALVVPYTQDKQKLQQAQQMVLGAQIDIAVRDKATMELMPYAYRDPADLPRAETPPVVGSKLDVMKKTLEELRTEIDRARKSDDAVDQGRIEGLELRYKRMLEEVERHAAELEETQVLNESEAEGKERRQVEPKKTDDGR